VLIRGLRSSDQVIGANISEKPVLSCNWASRNYTRAMLHIPKNFSKI